MKGDEVCGGQVKMMSPGIGRAGMTGEIPAAKKVERTSGTRGKCRKVGDKRVDAGRVSDGPE